MKLSTVILGASLVGNAALLVLFVSRPALAPPVFRDWFTSDAQRAAMLATETKAAQERTAATAKASAAKRTGVWASLQTDDLKSLVARLRAAGFSPVVIRAIVNARLEASFSSRMSELLGNADVPFWKNDPFNSYNNAKFYESQNQIYRDRTKAMREILGDDFFANAADATTDQRRRFGNLSKAKIDLVQRIVDDYAEMNSQVKIASQGIALPEDREKMALLDREKHADLASILSPEELADYEMRNSTVTQRLRAPLNILNATEAEFQAIYNATQPYASLLYPEYMGGMSFTTAEMQQQRTDAQKKINDQLVAALGADRAAEYARASNYEYQNLYRLAQNQNIPTDAINRTYDLRDSAAAASLKIHDTLKNPDDRTAALQALVTETKAKIISNLGSTVAENYIKNLNWLNAIDRGYALRPSQTGNGFTYLSAPNPNPGK